MANIQHRVARDDDRATNVPRRPAASPAPRRFYITSADDHPVIRTVNVAPRREAVRRDDAPADAEPGAGRDEAASSGRPSVHRFPQVPKIVRAVVERTAR